MAPEHAATSSDDEPICEVVITAPDSERLADVTRRLVDRRLVAGSHQIESVRSIYRWQGEIHDVQEARVTLRTRTALFPAIAEAVAALHPHRTPSIVAFPIQCATPAYHRWIIDETLLP
jgi:periplasmic divalent cation tolerance protein